MTLAQNNIIMSGKGFYASISEYRTGIMGLSIISIMFFHQYFISIIPFNLFHNFGYWGVDVFIFLSGMGLVNSLRKNSIKQFYINRIQRLLPSCIICGTTKYLTFLALGTSVLILKDGLHLGFWSTASLDLWYIHTIIILYTFSPIFYNLLIKWPKYTIIFAFILFIFNELTLRPIIGFNWFSSIGILSWTIGRLPIFIIGMFLSIKNILNRKNLIISLLLLLTAIFTKIYSKDDSIIYFHFFTNILLILGIPSLVLLAIQLIKYLPNSIKRILDFLGTYSLELYLVHEFIFWTIKVYYNDYNPWILLPISILLSCAAAYICKALSNKVLMLFK